MADIMITLNSKNYTQINPLNWDLHEIKRYKDEKCFVYDGNRIKWTDLFEMLKLFIRCCVSQPGIWSAPCGKYKKFCSTNKDLTLTWNLKKRAQLRVIISLVQPSFPLLSLCQVFVPWLIVCAIDIAAHFTAHKAQILIFWRMCSIFFVIKKGRFLFFDLEFL